MDWLTLIGLGFTEVGLALYLGKFLAWITAGFDDDEDLDESE